MARLHHTHVIGQCIQWRRLQPYFNLNKLEFLKQKKFLRIQNETPAKYKKRIKNVTNTRIRIIDWTAIVEQQPSIKITSNQKIESNIIVLFCAFKSYCLKCYIREDLTDFTLIN